MSESAAPKTQRGVSALLRRTWVRNVLGLCVLGAIVAALFGIDHVLSDTSTGALDNKHPEVGNAAPLFALRDQDGVLRRLDDYRGKAVWINFWATTCGPCREELPAIQKVANEVPDDELVVLEVNQQETRSRAQTYLDDIGVDLPVLFDSDGDVSQQYRLLGLPYNFFIDEDGILRSFKPGFLSEEEMRERIAELGVRASN